MDFRKTAIAFAALASALPGAENTTVRYACPGGERFTVVFQPAAAASGSTRAQRAVLQFPGKPPIALPQVVSASGARYSDGYTTLWIKGPEALIESGSVNVKDCRETTTAPVRSLTGKWSLRELNGKPVPLERPPYMEFQSQGERVAGMSGCNRFSANYTAKDASLRFGMAISTQMACPGNVMAVEDAFLKAIEATASHKLEGGELSLIDASGNVLARFKAE